MRLAGLLAAVASGALGCSSSSAAGGAADAGPEGGYAVCPPGLDASYSDLLTRVFSTSSCGTSVAFDCHSPSGASPGGAGNLLNFALAGDGGLTPTAVYAELLGADAGGQLAANIAGSAKILRVAPGDAGASLLYVKLSLTAHDSPSFGSGMPFNAPGSVCPEALDAVKTWIDRGAAQN